MINKLNLMNHSKIALAAFLFIFISVTGFAQTSFVSDADAISILTNLQSVSEQERSALTLDSSATADEIADYQLVSDDLEFKIGVSAKMLRGIQNQSLSVTATLVSLLSELENETIDVATYAFGNQQLSASAAKVNDFVISLLGN